MPSSHQTYNNYVVDKYGEDTSLHPEIDMELLPQTVGGKKAGRMYGIGTIADPGVVRVHKRDVTMIRFVERLKEKIAELVQDKIEKHAMMEKIEEGARLYAEMNEKIQLLSQNPPPTKDTLTFMVLLLDNLDLYRVTFGYV
ncbi:hypothetical protein HanPSC8_Chr08g0308531 [Helianthus annuus]|nr:hypothetical protein HanPSC8_Chr08g0308531 [Helianthus annuus]